MVSVLPDDQGLVGLVGLVPVGLVTYVMKIPNLEFELVSDLLDIPIFIECFMVLFDFGTPE